MDSSSVLPCLTLSNSIHDAISIINKTRRGIALIVDEANRLVGTVTDGDIRRGILAGVKLDRTIGELQKQRDGLSRRPVTAPIGSTREELISLMHEHQVQQIPLVDGEGRPVKLWTLRDLQGDGRVPVQALIMAGGFGERLRPLTDETPKPMLPVGDRPLMEHLVEQLRASGIRHVNISTHYKSEKISEHFGDGQDFGVSVRYVTEDRPLGTAGALGLLEEPKEPILVLNGDVLTTVDYRAFVQFHWDNHAILTVGVRKFEVRVPYGVAQLQAVHVKRLEEKPTFSFFVNAGVYLVDPAVLCYVPKDQRFDMPDLIGRLIQEGLRVIGFPIHEYWIDIGHHDDYQKAQQDIKDNRLDRAA